MRRAENCLLINGDIKMAGSTGNMLISQSGGPTVVINQSLAGAVLEAR